LIVAAIVTPGRSRETGLLRSLPVLAIAGWPTLVEDPSVGRGVIEPVEAEGARTGRGAGGVGECMDRADVRLHEDEWAIRALPSGLRDLGCHELWERSLARSVRRR
jgi:hypothetical protein